MQNLIPHPRSTHVAYFLWVPLLIQGVPMLHTFDGSHYTKNEKHMKKKNGKGHGGLQGHLHVTQRGTPTLSSQALHRYEPRHV